MLDVHPQVMEEHAFLAFMDVEKSGKANIHKSFLQGGWKVLEESRLLMLKARYKIRRVFDDHLVKSTDAVVDDELLRPEESKVIGGRSSTTRTQRLPWRTPTCSAAAPSSTWLETPKASGLWSTWRR